MNQKFIGGIAMFIALGGAISSSQAMTPPRAAHGEKDAGALTCPKKEQDPPPTNPTEGDGDLPPTPTKQGASGEPKAERPA